MKIRIEFDSMEEFLKYVSLNGALETAVINPTPAPTPMPFVDMPLPEPPVDTGTGAIVGATPEEQKQTETEVEAKAEEQPKPTPTYVLADAQKAVREVVKKKGKETAKEILGRFSHKDKEGPATGASALRPEDYAAAIAALEEALNG